MAARNGCAVFDQTGMYYASFGRGPRNLIVLPGLSDGLATVKNKALLLQGPYKPFFDEFTVTMFSRRNDLPPDHSIWKMAEDQAAALRSLGIKRTSVLGVSQGGMVAQALAIAHPELIDRLILAVTAPKANDMVRACLTRWIEYAKAGKHRELMISTAEHSYSPQKLKKYRKLYFLLGRIGKPADYGRFITNARAILDFDAEAALDRISAPTLILAGAEDQIVGVQASYEMKKRIPGADLYVYPGLGHGVYEEAVDFYPRVLEFLKGK